MMKRDPRRPFRTAQQSWADRLDCDLFRLLEQARDHKWPDTVRALERARATVRARMHPDDVKATI